MKKLSILLIILLTLSSLAITVNANEIKPESASLISPKGHISKIKPTYVWKAVANATWYYLWVNDETGNKIKKWLSAAQVGCNAGQKTCSFTPSIALKKGGGQWWIRTWNSVGYGAWSSATKIIIATDLPKTPTLVSPKGYISDTTPTYTWNAIVNSTWYQLWVNDSNGNKINKWLTAAQAGCNSGQKTCSYSPSIALTKGAGQWWVRTWNSAGYGAWSDIAKISIATNLPKTTSLVSPKGNTSDTTPSYTWNAIANSTWYYLWVNDASGNKIKKWLTASQAGCNSGQKICSYTSSIALKKGAGQWWVRTWNSAGYGAWSSALGFTIASSSNTDTTPPVISILGENPVNINQGSTYTDAGATAIDAVDGVVQVSSSGIVDTSKIATYSITYTAKDAAGNTATAKRVVTVAKQTTTKVTISGKVVDDPIVGATVSIYAQDGATLLESATTNANGFYTAILPISGYYILSVEGGSLNEKPFKGKMKTRCINLTNCNLTPFSTLIESLLDNYSGTLSEKTNKVSALLTKTLGFNATLDPFVKTVNSVDIAKLRAYLDNGNNLAAWINNLSLDILDGYLDTATLQAHYQSPRIRPKEAITISVDLDNLKVGSESNPIKAEQLKVYSMSSDASVSGEKETTATTSHYLSDIALLEKTDGTVTSDDNGILSDVIYQSFNLGEYKGKLNAETTVLSKLFMRTPALLFMPKSEQLIALGKISQHQDYLSVVETYKQFLLNEAQVSEELLFAQLDALSEDIINLLNAQVIAASSRKFLLKIKLKEQEIFSKEKRSFQRYSQGKEAKSSDEGVSFNLLEEGILSGGLVAKQKDITKPNLDFFSSLSLFYAIQTRADFDSQSGWKAFTDPKLIYPQAGFVDIENKKTNEDFSSVGASGTDYVVYSSSPRHPFSRPTVMNGLAIMTVIVEAAVGLKGSSKIIDKFVNTIDSLNKKLEWFNKAKEKFQASITAVTMIGRATCTLHDEILKREKKKIGVNNKDGECQPYIDRIDHVVEAMGAVTNTIQVTDAQYDSADKSSLKDTWSKIKNIKKSLSGKSLKELAKSVVRSDMLPAFVVDQLIQQCFTDSKPTFKPSPDRTVHIWSTYRLSRYLINKKYAEGSSYLTDVYYQNYEKKYHNVRPSYANYLKHGLGELAFEGMKGNKNAKKTCLSNQVDRLFKIANTLSAIDIIYKQLIKVIKEGLSPNGDVMKLIWDSSLDFLSNQAKSMALNALVSMTPAKVLHVAKAGNKAAGMAIDAMTKPSQVNFSIKKDPSGTLDISFKLPKIAHAKYLAFPKSHSQYLISASNMPTQGNIWQNKAWKEEVDRGVFAWGRDYDYEQSVTLSNNSQANNILMLPGGQFTLISRAIFDTDKEGDIEAFFANEPNQSATVDWHILSHRLGGKSQLLESLSNPPVRTAYNAFEGQSFTDFIPYKDLKILGSSKYYKNYDQGDGDPVLDDLLKINKLNDVSMIDLSKVYLGKYNGVHTQHNKAGVYTDRSKLVLSDGYYQADANVFVPYDYTALQPVFQQNSKLLIDDQGENLAVRLGGRLNSSIMVSDIANFGFYVALEVVDSKGIGRVLGPFHIWLDEIGKEINIPSYLLQKGGYSIKEVWIYGGIIQSYAERAGISPLNIIKIHRSRQRTAIVGSNLPNPFIIIDVSTLEKEKIIGLSDKDGDGIPDKYDLWEDDKRYASDTDGDGMADSWELDNDLDLFIDDKDLDEDTDELRNLDEFIADTNPHKKDTDGDEMLDGWEVKHKLNPLIDDANEDKDSDGVSNLQEFYDNTDPQDTNSFLPAFQAPVIEIKQLDSDTARLTWTSNRPIDFIDYCFAEEHIPDTNTPLLDCNELNSGWLRRVEIDKEGNPNYFDINGLVVNTTYYIQAIVGGANTRSPLSEEKNITIVDGTDIIHNGISYSTVTSPNTGKIWLDRNLGATKVCSSIDDTNCYGDYYQWGRGTDGHEKVDSETVVKIVTDINDSGDKFIRKRNNTSDWLYNIDQDGAIRRNNWNKTDGSSICPTGYRVPTDNEFKLETSAVSITDKAGVFDSFLKLPTAGGRSIEGAYANHVLGNYWSNTPASNTPHYLLFNGTDLDIKKTSQNHATEGAANGFSVRCIGDSGTVSLTEGLVAHYEFEGNANDSSANGNDGIGYGLNYTNINGLDVAKLENENESRLQLPYSYMPKSGSLIMNINISSGYRYSSSQFINDLDSALIFTTDILGGDVTYAGSSWFTVKRNGDISFSVATSKYGHTPGQTISKKLTNFSFDEWHQVGIGFGENGQIIYLDGKIIAKNESNTQFLGAGGNHSNSIDVPTIGESVPGFWSNNQYEGGFNGMLDDVKIYSRALNKAEIQELYKLGN